jgi:EpsI family protein
MADGFLHDFEGWVVFMACIAILILQMSLLTKIGRRRPLREAFGLEWPDPTPAGAAISRRQPGLPFLASIGLLVAAASVAALAPERTKADVPRKDFLHFPMQVDGWAAQRMSLDRIYTDVLQMDDYILANYAKTGERAQINFYAAYYTEQSTGRAVHSPRNCIPSGGWTILDLSERAVPGVTAGVEPLRVTRAVIQKGNAKQLVYYWLQQRGRVLTGEYETKWYILQDSFTRNRTDGALVRLVTEIPPGEDTEQADARLATFAASIAPSLSTFIPD